MVLSCQTRSNLQLSDTRYPIAKHLLHDIQSPFMLSGINGDFFVYYPRLCTLHSTHLHQKITQKRFLFAQFKMILYLCSRNESEEQHTIYYKVYRQQATSCCSLSRNTGIAGVLGIFDVYIIILFCMCEMARIVVEK